MTKPLSIEEKYQRALKRLIIKVLKTHSIKCYEIKNNYYDIPYNNTKKLINRTLTFTIEDKNNGINTA